MLGPDRSDIFVNPLIKHAILVEPMRVVGRTLRSQFVDIEAEKPVSRLLGGFVAYFSVDRPFAVDRGRGWESGHKLVLIPPYEPHRLRRCEGLRTILIEPESVCPQTMDDERWREGTHANRAWVERIEGGFAAWEQLGDVPAQSIDELVFGADLPGRMLDHRIAAAVAVITARPSGPRSGVEDLAGRAGLSPSRLSHLFRDQLGIPIRTFRAWKRMRNAMELTATEPVLIHAALAAGYADEPHYSRSMRKYFGQHACLMQRHWRHAMTFRAGKPHYA